MTLVVARVIDGAVRILSDWKVTYADGRSSGPLEGTLKAFPLSLYVALAFAGDINKAKDAVRSLSSDDTRSDAQDIANALAPITQSDDVEFLTASESSIHVVRSGLVQPSQLVAWLGDHSAFAVYQSHFHEPLPYTTLPPPGMTPEGNEAIDRMLRGFEAALADDRLPSVDGFQITLTARSSSGPGFHFLPISRGSGFAPVTLSPTPQSLTRSLTAEEGGYSYSVLVPKDFGVAAIGAHFAQGAFGALFRPSSEAPVIVKNVSAEGFIDSIARDYGIRLWGFPWSSSGIQV